MHVLTLDIGSYSVKYVSSIVDRRKISHLDLSEITLKDYISDHKDLSHEECVNGIIREIVDSVARPETKIIFQVDHRLLTTRFLTLPVKNKKKAELMLPFQLEEDIPYSLSEIHYAYRLETQKSQSFALVELVKTNIFDPHYHIMKDQNILPNILTTESSIVENFFNSNPLAGPFCLLDIGHQTTKAYFFFNSRLLMTNICYVGGQQINEMIAETYQIDQEEAIIYKHQNAYFLTSSQYNEVEGSQRDFAIAMDKTFSQIVNDFKRWKVGFKVNFGMSIQHVFLCGGSSNIKNISNYLSEKLDVKVTLFESFDKVEADKVDLNSKNKSKFAMANMMVVGFKRKNRFINFLTGKFAQASSTEIPLNSFAFLAVRATAATLLLLISLFAERYFIYKDLATLNLKMNNVMKSSDLKIPGRLRRLAVTNPKPVLDSLNKKQREIKQEISTLQSAIETNALSSLVMTSQISAPFKEVTLINFTSNNSREISAIFTSESLDELSKLKAQFERSSFSSIEANLDESALQLNVKAREY